MTAKKKTNTNRPSVAPGVDLSEVERLLEFMSQHGLEEFEYARGEFHVRLKKRGTAAAHYSPALAPEIVVAGPATSAAGGEANPAPTAEVGAETARGEDLHIIKSPIVGTFYGSPSPGAEPFVKVGDQVSAGQVLCIIEAMKLMNEIESEIAGEIARIYVESGQAVEYGESLFAIRPARRK